MGYGFVLRPLPFFFELVLHTETIDIRDCVTGIGNLIFTHPMSITRSLWTYSTCCRLGNQNDDYKSCCMSTVSLSKRTNI